MSDNPVTVTEPQESRQEEREATLEALRQYKKTQGLPAGALAHHSISYSGSGARNPKIPNRDKSYSAILVCKSRHSGHESGRRQLSGNYPTKTKAIQYADRVAGRLNSISLMNLMTLYAVLDTQEQEAAADPEPVEDFNNE